MDDVQNNYAWQDEESDLSSPKSTTTSNNDNQIDGDDQEGGDQESGDEVEDIPESDGGGIKNHNNKSGSTTESYSSVLQEDGDDDILKDLLSDIANGNHQQLNVKLSPTDSESTSGQLTQRFVDIYVTDNNDVAGE